MWHSDERPVQTGWYMEQVPAERHDWDEEALPEPENEKAPRPEPEGERVYPCLR